MAVVSDPSGWQELWALTWSDSLPPPPLPTIDFVLTSVVVAGLGQRAGQGLAISVDSIVMRVTGAVAYATEAQPSAHCVGATGSAAPVHMVHAPGHPPVVAWVLSTNRVGCTP